MPRPAPLSTAALALPQSACLARCRAVPLALLGLAFALRLAGTIDRPLWFDEGYTIYFAGSSPVETARLTALDIHPPFYYWSLQLWTALVGWNELSVRFYSVALGTLTVAGVIAFGSRAVGQRSAWLAAAALALSPLHVAYSFEVRMYALVTLLALLATWQWWRVATGRSVALYGGVMAAALLTQYYAGFLFLAHALTLPLFGHRRLRLLALLLAGAPFALWAASAGSQLAAYVQTKVAVEGYLPLDPVSFFGGFGAAAFGGGALGAAAAVTAAALALASLARPARPVAMLLAVAVVLPLALGYLVNLRYPFNPPGWERLFLFVLPLWLLLAADGAARVLPQFGARPVIFVLGGAAAALLLAASSAGVWAALAQRPADDPRPMIRVIERLAHPSDLYLAVYPWQVGYLRLYDRRPPPEARLVPAELWAADPAAMERDLAAWTAGRRVWLPAYQRLGRQLESRLERAFSEQLFLISADWYGDHRLLFAQAGEAPDVRARDVRFGDRLLVSAAIDPAPVEAGKGAVPVELVWGAAPSPATAHLRLADARGVTWAHHDTRVMTERAATVDRRAVLVLPATPPGRYRLLLSLSDGTALLSAVRPGAPPAPELDLGEIEVQPARTPLPPDSLAIGRPLRRTVAPGLQLLGAEFGEGPYHVGEAVLVSLYWLPASEEMPEVTLRIGGAASRARPPQGRLHEPIREVREVILRERGRLAVEVAGPFGTTRLGEVNVIGRAPAADVPTPATLLNVRFGSAIRLIGATVFGPESQVLPSGALGREMEVELLWQTAAPLDEDLAVFVHLVGPDGRPVAQHDSRPANGTAPTRGWAPGEIIIDRHRLVAPAGIAGEYALVVGLYHPPAGPRLPAETGESVLVHWGVLP
ncbi:MAG: glycosyltransferase family 39 protein [Dehalococcoidia bacterium]|nr:glycosyltransferase family 39 protein [Dehalococcoidia bacterium]